MKLKQIFETLNNFKSTTYQQKNIDRVDHYNFTINYMNIRGRLEILIFEFQNI